MTDTNPAEGATNTPTLVESIRQQLTEGRDEISAQLQKVTEKRDTELDRVRDKYADQVTALEAELAEADRVLANLDGRPGRATKSSSGGSGRGRPRGTGKRADEAVEIITANPGITIPGIAEKMGIGPNYLYRLLPGLVEAGRVWKDGQGWRPAHDPRQ